MGTGQLASERVIVQAPLSYTGSGRRIWRLGNGTGWLAPALVLLVAVAWIGVTFWYLTFGLLLTPYRLMRRGSRKAKRDNLRHREMLERTR